MKSVTYDIFISYRRENGADTAKHLRDILTAKGYSVFFDTDSLRSGSFNHELINVISNCRDFILILSPNSLDRCVNENDWVRQEIVCALETGKNIIPVLNSNFRFPDKLPEDINEVRWKNGIAVNIEYFDAMVDKLLSFLQSKPRRRIIRWLLPVSVVCILMTAAIVVILRSGEPKGNVKDNVISLSDDYLIQLVDEGDAAYYSGDFLTAIQRYTQAAEQGYAPAQNNLGFMYLSGMGLDQSYEKAFEYMNSAAEQGYAPAQSNLGYIYCFGLGTEPSYEEAYRYNSLAADQGDAPGQCNLGYQYCYGLGVEQSYEKAVEYYQLSADQDYAAAIDHLGYMYEHGFGVEQSYEKAAEYYQAAAEKGYQPSADILNEWAANGTPAPLPAAGEQ